MLTVVTDDDARAELAAGLDEIVREGARRMLAAALEAEVDAYIEAMAGELDERGRRLVVRNGHAEPRTITTAAGGIEIEAPRVDDRRVDPDTGERLRFRSAIVPPVVPQEPQGGRGAAADVPARDVERRLRPGPERVLRLRRRPVGLGDHPPDQQWQDERAAFARRELSGVDYVYVWADGIHFNVRLEEERLCALVIVGVRADGTKELVAIEDGYRESTESWADVLRDLKRRGMRAPVLAVGDGALGFWGALREVFPATVAQRCWVHKVANVLSALPASAQPTARRMLADIRDAEDRDHAVTAITALAEAYAAKYPKAVAKIVDDTETLLAFFDFPAEHWIHLKTTNPIESTFATVRLRTKVTKGPGSRAAGLAMAFKLIEAAQGRWRAVNGSHLVALVRAGAKFEKGVMVERPNQQDQEAAA